MQNLRGDASKLPPIDDCSALAPFVMALFDGEVDELEARRARAHLLVCRTCANRWLDWNRARDLLQATPVAPPPFLLWRVLMACRLASFARPVSKTHSSSSIFTSKYKSEAPAALTAQILANTTRCDAHASSDATRREKTTIRPQRPYFFGLKTPYLAAPALAIWLLILQRDTTFVPTVVNPPRDAQKQTAKRVRPQRASAGPLIVRLSRSSRPVIAPVTDGVLVPRVLSTTAVSPSSIEPRHIASALFRTRKIAFHPPQQPKLDFPTSKLVIEEEISERVESNKRRAQLTVIRETAAPRPVVAAVSLTPRPSAAGSRRAEFALALAAHAPRLRVALWKKSALTADGNSAAHTPKKLVLPRENRSGERELNVPNEPQILRVSLPTSTRPSFAKARLLSDNFDSDDAGIEEVRSVVDDFRATLATDDTASEDGPNLR